MRRGCISSEEIRCDGCQCNISFVERYLATDEEEGVKLKKGKSAHYCLDCCLKRGYAEYRTEKGEKILTFFAGKA